MADPTIPRTTRSRAKSPQPHYNSDSSRKRRKYIPSESDGLELSAAVEKHERGQYTASRQALHMGGIVTPVANSRPRRDPPSTAPMFSSAAAAASQANDYKPREEKSWEEFHPDLDIDAPITVFSADEVDGVPRDEHPGDFTTAHSPSRNLSNNDNSNGSTTYVQAESPINMSSISPYKRRPGRPPRRPESMLTGLGSPPAPRIAPLPAQNPRERLNLPKPSFRKVDTFIAYEADRDVQVNYVDSQMAHAGFQESEMFIRSDKNLIRLSETIADEHILLPQRDNGKSLSGSHSNALTQVEYDMDEQDLQWLDAYNAYRKTEGVPPIKPAIFEITLTQIEKEWHALEKRIPKPNPKPPQTQRPRSSSAAAVNGEPPGPGEEQDSKCAICDDGDCENTNAIVFCDGCDLAVHQECYGVPFIPEGQWLCRKCQMIGRGVPTCIFCPNTDGAFKLTNESRWVHLLCAIWIPEVSLGNMTFMEPIMDVPKVPKQRWKLNCYICNQKMGACIQCGNKNCYQAFHVSCARRAKLYLKMKSTHGGPASIDASVLKALCDKHVPQEWRNEHDVDAATSATKRFYRKTMKGRQWADSQQAALAQLPSYAHFDAADSNMDQLNQNDGRTSPNQKRKRQQAQKNVWRLPSGAPIVPKIVFNNVETSLTKFELRKRKEYASDACKYWTLKREARRGASLLKRLQLQLDTFSSTEIARRDFAGMGAAGAPRLQRRIEFAEQLLQDLDRLRNMCIDVKERESMKLRDAELLRSVIDTLYFPIPPLLWPILEKAKRLDTRGFFSAGFQSLQSRLEDRAYTSVASFSVDLGSVFQSIVGADAVGDAIRTHDQLHENSFINGNLKLDQKDMKKLAKRIVKAIQQPLQDATKREAELGGRPFEKELRNLEALLDNSIGVISNELLDTEVNGDETKSQLDDDEEGDVDNAYIVDDINKDLSEETQVGLPNGDDNTKALLNGVKYRTFQQSHEQDRPNVHNNTGTISPDSQLQGLSTRATNMKANGDGPASKSSTDELSAARNATISMNAPLTPPTSEKDKDLLAPLLHGGIPWYMETFDPEGTTVYEDRWTGREVMRGMSEELSELDEDELNDLGVTDEVAQDIASKSVGSARKPAKKKRRRGYW